MEFEKYLKENNSSMITSNIVDKVQDKPNYKAVNNQKIWSRNPRYASEVVAAESYLCEFNNQHKHFISKFNRKNYVEAHHLIPMKCQDGDYCLPNIIIDKGKVSGFIDWGRAGVSDRYQDLALAIRSITYNFGKEHIPFFLKEYGVKELDESKIFYYQLMDEFF